MHVKIDVILLERMVIMKISNSKIDDGKAFDWGLTSKEYAKYRDIYPDEFYKKIIDRGLCINGQKVLDLGTGTGVLPRNMYRYGAEWTGTDISENQISEAIKMSREANMDIRYMVSSSENIDFDSDMFDVVTSCQCFWYFDHKVLAPKLHKIIKKGGHLLVLFMAWLPFEDKIAGESEKIILKYNPVWSGCGEKKHPINIDEAILEYFDFAGHEEYDIMVPFTRETWHGRMKACRGVGASLSPEEIALWENEHLDMLNKMAPDRFNIHHYAALADLVVKK